MSTSLAHRMRRAAALLAAVTLAVPMPLASGVAAAQIQSVDPNTMIDGDLAPGAPADPYSDGYRDDGSLPYDSGVAESDAGLSNDAQGNAGVDYNDPAYDPAPRAAADGAIPVAAAEPDTTYQKDDLIGAAEGVFGKGAEGLAGVIEDILKKQGEPNGYIVGREAGGAFVVGLRYGSGTLYHKVEGERDVYWTGPSIGFDAGANAGNSFILVYNLYDTDELYKRYGAGEGAAYLIGGFHVSYLRRKDVVLIPVRLGVGVRLGANVGYMKFSENQRWLPF